MAVNTGDILRVACRMHHATHGDLVNVFHYRSTSAAPVDDSDVLGDMAAYMDTLYKTIDQDMHKDWTFEDVNVFDVTQNRPLGVAAWPTLVAGGDEYNDCQPSQVAALVRGTTGYSRNWARKFIGGLTEARNTSGGFVDSTTMTDLAAFAAAWIAGGLGSGGETFEPVVWHKAASMWRPITEAVIRNVWSTVRTRRTGRGA